MNFSSEFLDGMLLATVMLGEDPIPALDEDLALAWSPWWRDYRSRPRRDKHARIRQVLAHLRPERLSPPLTSMPCEEEPALARFLEYWHHVDAEGRR